MIEIGEKFLERYFIEKQIADTISGVTVWKAIDESFDSEVAIKEIKIDKGKEKEARETAKREARLMRRLSGSPHIINVWDIQSDDNAVYLFMEYAAGGSLRDLLKREGTLSEERARTICIGICKGVTYAHDRDIMHRDLKPENILFVEGVAKIGDFGIARVLEGSRKASSAGVGTSQYIAPEQYDDEYNKRVDTWAIGIILYEMLVGNPPFVGKTPRQIMKKICDDELKIPQSIDEPFRTVIQKALQKDPDDRYQTVDEIQETLTTPSRSERISVPFTKKALEPQTKYQKKDGMKMVYIPAGTFMMGSDDGEDNEKPVHEVYTDAFHMDEHEVTNEQYCKFLNSIKVMDDGNRWLDSYKSRLIYHNWKYCNIEESGSGFKPKSGYENHPVVSVYWYGANKYAKWVEGRLPTEAEWEKAARGGLVEKKYPNGNFISQNDANYSGTGTAPVKSFAPNGYGLYDMAGNVHEWCSDWWDADYYSKSPKNNPTGPSSGSGDHVARGGSWYSKDSSRVRCACRHSGVDGTYPLYDVCFRVVMSFNP